ncbi:hypothetical protein ONE63_009255 [Megalurothrips usitatus]|uniref:Glutaredoxin domain-containing protein n=1 Tax=Megalurothrips usitatus TaxID=439358 RepID=A0AAV7XJ17_9NEOP|nr:hypothetical protein ONE63_009255 [Megalurothrips usitatus]
MGVVRGTYQRCVRVKQILRTLLVRFDEKDVFMSREVQAELMERMRQDAIQVPQVFVEGQHVGVSSFCFFLQFKMFHDSIIRKLENLYKKTQFFLKKNEIAYSLVKFDGSRFFFLNSKLKVF